MKNWMFNGKLKGSLEYFFEDENFGGVWENSKFETETSKSGGGGGGARAVRFGCKTIKTR